MTQVEARKSVQALALTVAVATYVYDHGRILIGRRQCGPGEGLWFVPSGTPRFGEDLFVTAQRIVREQTGLEVHAYRDLGWTSNVIEADELHMLMHYFLAEPRGGCLENRQPEYIDELKWIGLLDMENTDHHELHASYTLKYGIRRFF